VGMEKASHDPTVSARPDDDATAPRGGSPESNLPHATEGHVRDNTWLWLIGGGVLLYFAYQNNWFGLGTATTASTTTPAPAASVPVSAAPPVASIPFNPAPPVVPVVGNPNLYPNLYSLPVGVGPSTQPLPLGTTRTVSAPSAPMAGGGRQRVTQGPVSL